MTAGAICEELRKRVKKEGITDAEKVREMMYEVVAEMLRGGQELDIENKPAIINPLSLNLNLANPYAIKLQINV